MSSVTYRKISLGLFLASICFPAFPSNAQDRDPAPQSSQSWLDPSVKEIYKKWLTEDVAWIISDQERADFKKLSNDKQRDDFVVAFWERRNPNPGSSENKFKEAHYQSLAYANTNFAAGVPGWKTDRGRMYIMYGPPDNVVRHLQSDSVQKSAFNTEEWHWKYIEGIGRDVIIRFVDTCGCSEYHIPIEEKDLQKYK
jgi:GWxTD domain-containing protein